MEFKLQGEHRYELRVSADEFEELIKEHPDIELLDGAPKRQRGRDAFRALYYAWRTGPGEFVMTTMGQLVDTGELEAPALTFRFEENGDGEGALVRVKEQPYLSAWDGVAQTSLQVAQGFVFWLDRIRWWFTVSFLSAFAGLLVWSTAPQLWLTQALGVLIFVAAQVGFLYHHVRNPKLDSAKLAWEQEHAALAKVTGDLITPQLRGCGPEGAYRALTAPEA